MKLREINHDISKLKVKEPPRYYAMKKCLHLYRHRRHVIKSNPMLNHQSLMPALLP